MVKLKSIVSNLLITYFVVLAITIVYAQDKSRDLQIKRKLHSANIHFLDIRVLGNGKWEVTFTILGIKDNEHKDQIINSLIQDPRVFECKIFYNRRCKMVIDEYFTALELREILKKHNTDFDIETVFVNDLRTDIISELLAFKEKYPVNYVPQPKEEWIYPPSFPKYVDTGNPEKDAEDFAKAKQRWIEEHPEEYFQMTGIEYLGETNRYMKY